MASTDWTFLDANWKLEDGFYVSSPSCLSIREDNGPNYIFYNNDTLIREGMIELSLRGNLASSSAGVIFRSQDNTAAKNAYIAYVTGGGGSWSWWHVDNGGSFNALGSFGSNTFNAATWYKFRITWWEARDDQNALATACKVEIYNGSWSQIGDVLYDTNRRFESSGTNMIGLYGSSSAAPAVYVDDVTIYQA